MSIETKLLMDKTITMQLKVITDELYEMMWELQPQQKSLYTIKTKLNTLVDKAWEEYNQQLQPNVNTNITPYEHEATI
jgi:cytochrome c oxidase assembly protein Cox11